MEKLNCEHSYTYSILHQHFPDHGEVQIQLLMELLDTINTQTCDCSNHGDLPLHGPSKHIREPIPTYEKMQQLHQQLNPDLTRSDLQELYVNTIISWIYARLYQYLTPYTDPAMNKKIGLPKPLDWEFHHAERTYLENRLSLMETEVNWQTRHKKLQHLADLKKLTVLVRPIKKTEYSIYSINSNFIIHLRTGNLSIQFYKSSHKDFLQLLVPVNRSLELPTPVNSFYMRLHLPMMELLKQLIKQAKNSHIPLSKMFSLILLVLLSHMCAATREKSIPSLISFLKSRDYHWW